MTIACRHLNSRSLLRLILIVALSCQWPTRLLAHDEAGSLPETRHSFHQCPQLFGSEETHTHNQALRERYLHLTMEEPSGITIVHIHEGWENVSAIQINGVEVEELQDDFGSGLTDRSAATLVKVSKELAQSVECPPGRYVLHRDFSIGQHTHILAIFHHAVLVLHDGKLGYLNAGAGGPPPHWLLAWKWPGVTFYPQLQSRGGQVKAPPKRVRHRPKPRSRRGRR